MQQFEPKYLEGDTLGEISNIKENPDGDIVITTQDAWLQTDGMLNRRLTFGAEFVGTFSPRGSFNLAEQNFTPLLTLGDAAAKYPIMPGHDAITRIIGVSAEGAIAYQRMLTTINTHAGTEEMLSDGFYVYDPATGATNEIPEGHFVVAILDSGEIITNNGDAFMTLSWDRVKSWWSPKPFLPEDPEAFPLCGKLDGHHLLAYEGERNKDQYGLLRVFQRSGNELPRELRHVVACAPIVDDVVTGVGLEFLPDRPTLQGQFWIDGVSGGLLPPPEMENSFHFGKPVGASSTWGVAGLEYYIIGQLNETVLNAGQLSMKATTAPMLWKAASEDLQEGRPIRGKSLYNVIPGDPVIEVRQIAGRGIILAETEQEAGVLLIPQP